jgi:uncharacterized glyoxalase superfamily protein PhnB
LLVDVYPCFTYRDVDAALEWLAEAFGLQPLVIHDQENEVIDRAAVTHGDGMVLIESERPQELHGSHAGKGWVYLAIQDVDAHYEHSKAAGAQVLNEPHKGPGGMRGYSARDLENNEWTFGTVRPTP